MTTVVLHTERAEESVVHCGADAWEELSRLFRTRRGFVFTDENVLRLYGDRLRAAAPGVPVWAMPAGEAHKNETTLFALLREVAEAGLRRNDTLVALGGGVVGDVGGLAASLYMRGIACVQIPTTLLAQVDSSVGGKTAVDFCGVKNLVGAFKQPTDVYADPSFFATLPAREIRCGLGEIVKHGALDASLFSLLSENGDRLTDLTFLADIVPRNIAFKAEVVRKDPHERGLRKCLNLGHTTGHAVELSAETLSHGECVLYGILAEAELARRRLPCDGEYLGALKALCRRALAGAEKPALDAAKAARLALLDKKNAREGEIVCTVPVAAGEYRMLSLPFEEYVREFKEIWEELC